MMILFSKLFSVGNVLKSFKYGFGKVRVAKLQNNLNDGSGDRARLHWEVVAPPESDSLSPLSDIRVFAPLFSDPPTSNRGRVNKKHGNFGD